jgi:hypothetical protein
VIAYSLSFMTKTKIRLGVEIEIEWLGTVSATKKVIAASPRVKASALAIQL